MLICVDCGHVFDESEVFVVQETLDCIDGVPYRETHCTCPECNGDYEVAVQCKKCGEWFKWDDLVSGYYCSKCMADLLSDYDLLVEFAKGDEDAFADFVHEKEAPHVLGGERRANPK